MESSNKVTVEVTQDDINKGKRRCCESCAITLALTRAFGKKTEAAISCFSNEDGIGALPSKAVAFIWDFDDMKHVEPFTFEVKRPEKFDRNKILTIQGVS
jgi:hypothetical protein